MTFRFPVRSFLAGIALMTALPGALMAADGQAQTDIARVLAGIQPSENSPLQAVAKDASFKKHQSFMDSSWKQLEDKQLSKVRSWSSDNVKQQEPTLYYLFSGPDYLYANAFFPKAKTIIMAGLEPSGPVPELSDLTVRTANSELNGTRAALGSLLKHSYFITSEMGHQLSRRKLSGTLPIIYVFAARSGKDIKDVSLIALDREGKLHAADEPGIDSAAKGAKIVLAGADGEEQTIYYFKTDLSNKGVQASGFIKFLDGYGQGDAFIKSASYLLHNPGFSDVRDFLLKHSAALVQDDTGIPVKYLDANWQLQPFGSYLAPIAQFRHAQQPKLVDLFKKESKGPLGFTVGYRWGKPSNLLLAVKAPPRS